MTAWIAIQIGLLVVLAPTVFIIGRRINRDGDAALCDLDKSVDIVVAQPPRLCKQGARPRSVLSEQTAEIPLH